MFPWVKRVWDVMFPDSKAKSTDDKPATVPVFKPAPANLSVKRTELVENRTKNSRKLARTDLTFRQDTEILKFTPEDEDVTQASKYNFKIKVTINDMEPILAELDSDSHISLISERYYNQILEQGPVEFLNEEPLSFQGMGSSLSSKHPAIMLNVQIGRVMMKGRFIITEHLNTSPVLIGSDFMVKNQLSNGFYSNDSWFVSIGPVDKPLGKVPTIVTSKLVLANDEMVDFEPFMLKKLTFTLSKPTFAKANPEFIHSNNLKESEFLSNSPFEIEEVDLQNNCITLRNTAPVRTTLLSGMDLVETDFQTYKIGDPSIPPR